MTNKITLSKWLIHVISYFLGTVFLVAAGSKLLAFRKFVITVGTYGIFPRGWIPVLAAALIGIEIGLGALFLVKRYQGLAAGAASMLLTSFIGLAVYAGVRGIAVECGCFGFVRTHITSLVHMGQNVILLILSMIVFRHKIS